MSKDTTPTESLEDSVGKAQVAETTRSNDANPQDGNPKAQDGQGKKEGDALASELAETRRENQNLRRRLRELEEKVQEAEYAKLSDLERATKEREAWKTKYEALVVSLKRERVMARALDLATKAGAIEPAAVAKLVAVEEIDFDDDLSPRNVDELVAAIKRQHPRLFSAAPGKGNGGERDETRRTEPADAMDRLRQAYSKTPIRG